ncbi:unnamed protein product [Prunus armeniaca]|uniref:Uncharacterized protein n=1 Tax=Prunus armeniaca TaxID=36596 RepID=A0A6J5WUG0_PRUAR|nr:unnamed protein product [Prunus armeniaca]
MGKREGIDPQKSTEKQFSKKISNDPQSDQQNSITEVPSNKSRKITRGDIEVVQNLIERCLQLYMNRNEVINTLLDRARIEPGFTSLVLQKLEEENAEFFKAYYIRLKLKNQIVLYNRLLEQQYHLMKDQVPPDVPLPPMQNGMHYMPVHSSSMGYPIMQQPPIPSNRHRQISNMGTTSSCHVVNGIPAQGHFHHMPLNCGNESLADAPSIIPASGIKTEMLSSPVSVASNGQFPFTPSEISGLGVDTSALDSAFTSHLANLERLGIGPDGGTRWPKETLRSSGQSTWNFGLFDSTAEWPNLQDLGALGNYSGSPFLPPESDVLDSPEQNDMVEEFFADAGSGQGSQSE